MVDTAAQAAELVAATRYPPAGVRDVSTLTRAARGGGISDYLKHARDEICLIVQIEGKAGPDNVDEIARVDGVDALFMGPADLAAALGHLGQPGAPAVQEVVDNAPARFHSAGKPSGIVTTDEALARKYLAMGVGFVAVGVDSALLAQATSALCNRVSAR